MALDRGLLESQRDRERVVSVIYWESCLLVVQCHSYTRMILAGDLLELDLDSKLKLELGTRE